MEEKIEISKIIVYCEDCGKQLCKGAKVTGTKRCRKCAGKKHSEFMKSPDSPFYFHGETLVDHYCPECKIAKISYSTFMKQGLCRSCARKGDKHPNWNGGVALHPYSYEFSKDLKRKIRERDSYICQECGVTEEEYKKYSQDGRNLECHHIDYDKSNSSEDNLITLCGKCNIHANSNRNYWTKHFKNILLSNVI